MEIVVRPLVEGSLEEEVEVVEHKGIGHPDTMCDALAEAFGVALARVYLERFGSVLHFNVDKALLVGGQSRPAFGGGEVIAPMQVLLAGRATREFRGVRVPVDDIAVETSKAWVRENMHALSPERHVIWSCLAREDRGPGRPVPDAETGRNLAVARERHLLRRRVRASVAPGARRPCLRGSPPRAGARASRGR